MDNIQVIFNNLDSKVNFSSKPQEITVQFIKNPDESIRWIWPSNCKSPLFLKFYNVQGMKAIIFDLVIKFIFAFRLQKIVFKSGKVVSLNQALTSHDDWALFTGTVGPNQKYILYQKDASSKNGSFTKIALTPQSQKLIINERKAIEILGKGEKVDFLFPDVVNSDADSVSFKENSSFSKRKNLWSKQHTQFLDSLPDVHAGEYSFEDFDQKHNINSRIESLKNSRKKVPSGIIKKLKYLHQSLHNTKIKTQLVHGDFTPWNTYLNNSDDLYIYDWELSSENYPFGFDFFHFIIQNGVLTQHKSWREIKNEIDKYHETIFKNGDCEKYLSFYLLVNVLNYLEIYEKQENWHTQIQWLLETWNLALSDLLKSFVNQRELIVLDTFDQLHFTDYAGLKLNDQVEKVSVYSDIDLLMEKKTSKMLIQFLKNHPLIQKVHLQRGIAMTKMLIMTKDSQIISMDHIFQLKRKSLEYMNVSALIKNPYIDKHGIKKMNLMDTLKFIGLFYGLNNAAIPEKYRKYANVCNTGNSLLDNIINKELSTGAPSQKELYNEISRLPENNGISGLKNKIFYLFDTMKNIIGQKGLVITFSGVDGSGKSTVIENTKREIEKKLRKKVVVIRHRPSLLPILSAWTKGKVEAEKEAAEKLPRQGQNKSLWSSLFRFGYYYTDYLFGQFYIYFKYVLRGDVVLYDRYYFDFINDSVRSNITLPKWILKSGYNLLLKPDLNFFLYADAQTILSRKKELSESTINALTSDYLGLFRKLGSSKIYQYQAIENIHLEQTIDCISSSIQRKLI